MGKGNLNIKKATRRQLIKEYREVYALIPSNEPFEFKKPKSTFVNCFRIAKKNKGVLYYNETRKCFSYSVCKDLNADVFYDFRTGSGRKYGKELSHTDRKSFYKVDK